MAETYKPQTFHSLRSFNDVLHENRDLKTRITQLCEFIKDQAQLLDQREQALHAYAARITELEAWKHEALSFHGDDIRPGHIDRGEAHHAAELALIGGLDGKGP